MPQRCRPEALDGAGRFIPRAEVKAARDVLRYRTKVAQQRVSEIARLGNVLQDAGIKIDSVAWSWPIATKFRAS